MLRVIHAADLHLDSPFASLPPAQAVRRRKQQRRILQEITTLCGSADLVLLAGDVFDDRNVRPETVELMQTLFAQWKIPVFIAPGNHDPYTDTSLWSRVPWPENVHIFTGAMDAVELPHLRCRVWGAAFREREAAELLRPIPKSHDGFLEIGVFHGDPVYNSPYHPISAETIRDCGLDYLALGHIHKGQLPKQLGRTYYGWPGVTMGLLVQSLGFGTHGLQQLQDVGSVVLTRRLQITGSVVVAQRLSCMWDLSGPGIKPVSPTLQGGS